MIIPEDKLNALIQGYEDLEKENKKLQNQIQKLYGDLYNKE